MKSKFIITILVLQLLSLAEAAQIQVTRNSNFARNSANGPSFAVNTQTGEILVVWGERATFGEQPQVFGRLLDPKGKPITKAFQLIRGVTDGSVAYNPVTNEYLLAYDDFQTNQQTFSGVFVQRLSSNGHRIKAAIQVSNDSSVKAYINADPELTFNPTTGGYILTWFVNTGGRPRPAYLTGVLLTDRGRPGGPLTEIVTNTNYPDGRAGLWRDCQDWSYLPSADKMLAICREADRQGPPYRWDYLLAVIDPMLKNIAPSNFVRISGVVGDSSSIWDASFHLALVSESSAVVYFLDQKGKIKGQGIDAQGKLSGKEFSAFKSPKKKTSFYSLSAAFVDTPQGRRGLLLGTERVGHHGPGSTGHGGPGSVWAQVLKADGRPMGAPVEILTAPNTGLIFRQVSALPANPFESTFPFISFEWLLNNGPLERMDPILELLLNVTFP